MKLPYYDNTEPDVRIEIVPLIDVIFCILTFFILAAVTLTRQSAINVDLPRASSGTTQLRELLIVSVDPIGQTYIEKQPVTRDQLYQAMINFRQTSPDGLVVLYASRASSYNDVVQVLDLLRSVGGSRVALATLPGGADNSTLQLPALPDGSGVPGGSNDLLQVPGLSPNPGAPQQLPGLEGLPGGTSDPTGSQSSASPSGANQLPAAGKPSNTGAKP